MPIALNNRRKKSNQTQDGRKLRGYKRRWKIEHLFAWLFNFRQRVVHYDYLLDHPINLESLVRHCDFFNRLLMRYFFV